MTTAAELRALAEEVEGLSGPDREMDVRIEVALGAARYGSSVAFPHVVECDDGTGWRLVRDARPYTASIDAAASLMPEGWEVEVYDDRHFRQRWCVVTNPPAGVHVPKPDVWTARPGATESLARCAAALRARAALLDEAPPTASAAP